MHNPSRQRSRPAARRPYAPDLQPRSALGRRDAEGRPGGLKMPSKRDRLCKMRKPHHSKENPDKLVGGTYPDEILEQIESEAGFIRIDGRI